MLLMFGIAFASGQINTALSGITNLLCTILPAVIMLAVVVAAILYAVGQLGSAESRAKFHGYATNIIIGAITALIVLLIVPVIINALLPSRQSLPQCGECVSPQKACEAKCSGPTAASCIYSCSAMPDTC